MASFLKVTDVQPLAPDVEEAVLNIYIEDVEADALSEAPCIADPDFPHKEALKGLLRQAVLRWAKLGEGQRTSYSATAGSFNVQEGFSAPPRSGAGRLLPREIGRLKKWCKELEAEDANPRQAFTYRPGQKRRPRL